MPLEREKTGIVLGMAITKAIIFPLNAIAEASASACNFKENPGFFSKYSYI